MPRRPLGPLLLLAAALLVIAAVGGCTGLPELPGPDQPGLPVSATVPPGTPPAAETPGAATATPVPATAPPAATATASSAIPHLKVEEVATGLEVPWSLSFAPDGRIFFTERPGRVRVIVGVQLQAEAVLDIPDVSPAGEGGLMGITLDPAFAENHYLYVYYTYADSQGGQRNKLVRYREANNTLTDPQVLFGDVLGAGIHDGGRIKFGPDGKLYITVGDAANGTQAQQRDVLAGKILRLNPDGSIPADNPFGTPIWSYGHRNPQGLDWQPGTGLLFETEHGQSAHDEVNIIEKGGNYGWPVVTAIPQQPEFVDPILTSGPPPSWAPSGAAFGTAPWLGAWQNNFFFATLRGVHLHRVALDPANPHHVLADEKLFEGVYGRLREVIQGPDGLYFTTSNRDGRGSPAPTDDRILRLVSDDQR
jgi:glucose/arabinose dehydrogenase